MKGAVLYENRNSIESGKGGGGAFLRLILSTKNIKQQFLLFRLFFCQSY